VKSITAQKMTTVKIVPTAGHLMHTPRELDGTAKPKTGFNQY